MLPLEFDEIHAHKSVYRGLWLLFSWGYGIMKKLF